MFQTCIDYKKCCKYATYVMFVLIIIGIGMSSTIIYNDGKNFQTSFKTCPEIPKTQIFTLKKNKDVFWKWSYSFEDFFYEHECPTLQYNSQLRYNGDLVSRSQGDFTGNYNNVYINDCHDRNIYKIETGYFEKKIKGINLKLVFLVKDKKDNVLSYVKSNADKTFEEMDDYDILNVNGTLISNVVNNDFNFYFNIYKPDDLGTDIRAIGTYFSHYGFYINEPKKDPCNDYFTYSSWTVITVVGLFSLFICCKCSIFFKKCIDKYCLKKNRYESKNYSSIQV